MTYEIKILVSRLLVIFSLWLLSLSQIGLSQDSSFFLIELSMMVIISTLFLYFKLSRDINDSNLSHNLNILYLATYFILSIFLPKLLIFLPVIISEIGLEQGFEIVLACLIFIRGFLFFESFSLFLFLLTTTFVLSWFYQILNAYHQFERESYHQIDQLRNINEHIRKEQNLLINLQDQRLETSRNNERKRIINEIHDILGHQLSSSVIQIAALQYLVDDSEVKAQLKAVQEVLNDGMNNIREIIHNEHHNVLHLKNELDEIISDFQMCPIKFIYENDTRPSSQVVHSVSNSVREALTNTIKHSNANQVDIRFQEHHDNWHLLIRDNGQIQENPEVSSGIGLINMEERILRLKGTFHLSTDKGFRIFIVIPKGGNTYESTTH